MECPGLVHCWGTHIHPSPTSPQEPQAKIFLVSTQLLQFVLTRTRKADSRMEHVKAVSAYLRSHLPLSPAWRVGAVSGSPLEIYNSAAVGSVPQ